MSDHGDQLKAAQEALQRGDFAAGLACAEALLAQDPKDGDALYVAAAAARYLDRHDAARSFLERLHAEMPEYGRAWRQESTGANQLAPSVRTTAASTDGSIASGP